MDQMAIEVSFDVVVLDFDNFIKMLRENGYDHQADEAEKQFNEQVGL